MCLHSSCMSLVAGLLRPRLFSSKLSKLKAAEKYSGSATVPKTNDLCNEITFKLKTLFSRLYLRLYTPHSVVLSHSESEVHTVHRRPLCTLQIVYSVHHRVHCTVLYCARGLAQTSKLAVYRRVQCLEWKYSGKDIVSNFFCFQYFRRRCVTFWVVGIRSS